MGGFGGNYPDMCGSYNYNGYPVNQFVLFPPQGYMSMGGLQGGKVNSGVPTSDSYIPPYQNVYQNEAFPQDNQEEHEKEASK